MKKTISEISIIIFVSLVFFTLSLFPHPPQQAGFEKRKKIIPVTALHNNLYICVLPFRKTDGQGRVEKNEISTLVTGEIFRGLRSLNRWNIHWCINEPGHTVKDDDTVFSELMNATFSSDMTGSAYIDNIIKNKMERDDVNILVTGLYHEDAQTGAITLRLLVYARKNWKIVMKNIRFKKGELVVEDPKTQQKSLNPSAIQKIEHMWRDIPEFQVDQTVKKILLEIESKKLKQCYVSNLSFLNAATQKIKETTAVSRLLNDPVVNLINQELVAWSKKNKLFLKFNQKDHQVPNTEDQVNQLIDIIFRQALEKKQRIEKIIDKFMVPNKVDVIVTGFFVEKSANKLISLRPVVIIKSLRKIVTFNLDIAADKLVQEDPKTKNKILGAEAAKDIKNMLQKHLEN